MFYLKLDPEKIWSHLLCITGGEKNADVEAMGP